MILDELVVAIEAGSRKMVPAWRATARVVGRKSLIQVEPPPPPIWFMNVMLFENGGEMGEA